MPSLAEIKEAGRAAKAKAREALALEEALSKDADKLWASAFDAVAGPDLREDELQRDCPALIVVPGFASWSALRPEHVERWRTAKLQEQYDYRPFYSCPWFTEYQYKTLKIGRVVQLSPK